MPTSGGTAEARSKERYRRATLTSASALGARGLALILSLATVPLTLNYLGPERYGMWVTISSVTAILAITDLGVGYGLLNAVTRALARGDQAAARGQISSALALLGLFAMALAGVLLLVAPLVSWSSLLAVTSARASAEAAPAVAVWAACFLVGMPLSVASQVRWARQEGYVVHLTAAAGSVAAVAALLAAIATEQGLPVLVVAMAGPPLLASAANGLLLFGRDAPELRPSLALSDRRAGLMLLRAGFLFFVLQIAMAVAFASDALVATQVVGPEAAAQYGVTYRLFMIPMALVSIGLTPLWPAYGEAITRGDVGWARTTLQRSLRAGLVVAVPTAGILVAFGLPIIAVWAGPTAMPPFMLLVGFGIWVVLSTIGMCVAMLLNGAHEIRAQAVSAAVMAVANLVLSIWLTDRMGVAGVIWGTVLAYGAFTLAPMAIYVPRVLRRLELAPPSASAALDTP